MLRVLILNFNNILIFKFFDCCVKGNGKKILSCIFNGGCFDCSFFISFI